MRPSHPPSQHHRGRDLPSILLAILELSHPDPPAPTAGSGNWAEPLLHIVAMMCQASTHLTALPNDSSSEGWGVLPVLPSREQHCSESQPYCTRKPLGNRDEAAHPSLLRRVCASPNQTGNSSWVHHSIHVWISVVYHSISVLLTCSHAHNMSHSKKLGTKRVQGQNQESNSRSPPKSWCYSEFHPSREK